MPNAYIRGTGGYVPPRVVSNDDLARIYGIETTDEWIARRTGVRERRFAEEGVGTADLAFEASRTALEEAGIAASDLDLIVFCTLSPDKGFPGSGVYLQQLLGLPEAGAFIPCMDVRNQCSGFLYGLSHAFAMVRAGLAQHVLLVGAEVHSAALDLSTRGRTVASLFGDGAGAVVVSATEADRGIRRIALGADGRHADALCQPIWNIRKRPFVQVDDEGNGYIPASELWAQMNGQLVFRNAVERMAETLQGVCADEGVALEDLDLVFFHQANLRINQLVASHLGLPPEKTPQNIDRYGNTTAATIPLMLAEASRNGRLRSGMKVAMVAFGSGFTWGAAIVDW